MHFENVFLYMDGFQALSFRIGAMTKKYWFRSGVDWHQWSYIMSILVHALNLAEVASAIQ